MFERNLAQWVFLAVLSMGCTIGLGMCVWHLAPGWIFSHSETYFAKCVVAEHRQGFGRMPLPCRPCFYRRWQKTIVSILGVLAYLTGGAGALSVWYEVPSALIIGGSVLTVVCGGVLYPPLYRGNELFGPCRPAEHTPSQVLAGNVLCTTCFWRTWRRFLVPVFVSFAGATGFLAFMFLAMPERG